MGMGKRYGERWQVCSDRPLATGSQSEILRVVDERRQFEGEYAFKRILRPQWHDRFGIEIEAVASFRHPNVIGLADDSAFRQENGKIPCPWLVMPIAGGEDLGDRRRAEAYRESIDWVMQVAGRLPPRSSPPTPQASFTAT
jgi:hypothetical protein